MLHRRSQHAYMSQQLPWCLQGERGYAALKGPTGPLVYPAGHLYLYTWLYSLTGQGSISAGQAVFAVIYWLNQVRRCAEGDEPMCVGCMPVSTGA